MKQLLILSGKGGTGKTTTASAFIRFSEARAFADCDVDAPNLHLAAGEFPDAPEMSLYYGTDMSMIDKEKCVSCGLCAETCKFGAIRMENGKYRVNPFVCEGCGVCMHVCPHGAVVMRPDTSGDVMTFRAEDRTFVTAMLKMGRGNSGKLVSAVKGKLAAEAPDVPFAVIDGSPGTGCPVIASITGVDMVLIVAEPSLSGLSDMQRILKVADILETPAVVCINKWDTSPEHAQKIEAYCAENNIPVLGRIPFDSAVPKAINDGISIADISCPARDALKSIYDKVMEMMA
ncbi:MAG: 4Fe-4S dicluster domain-containing protein [Clostridiales bacterium]|nr:4Fe-4S dicluster domain-containing protein [Clostridiales bacterium]